MKFKIILPLVMVVLGLLLYGAKYRQDHPPLSRADKLFRQMAERSDEIVIVCATTPTDPAQSIGFGGIGTVRLRGQQIRELEDNLGVMDEAENNYSSHGVDIYHLRFYRQKQLLGRLDLNLGRESPSVQAMPDSPSPLKSLVTPPAGDAT